ncbi:MAG: glycosyltransferase family 2 protein [Candidatus Bathyarchaeia archaeon]|jgi:dolichol-phosphate mannosyltransferase
MENRADHGQQITEKHNPIIYPNVLLLIPTVNEEEAIQQLIQEAGASGFTDILVVDGFSSDRTRDIAISMGARVVLQEFGKGKGCGVRTGMKLFLEGNSEFLSIIDGDETNIPSDLAKMVPAAQSGKADVVLGSRIRGVREKGAMPALSFASNLTVSFLLGAKFLRLFTDVQTGYWLFTREAVRRIYPKIQSMGFEIELELFVNILKEGFRVIEIPVGFRMRKGKTKFSFMLRMRNLYYAFKYLAS